MKLKRFQKIILELINSFHKINQMKKVFLILCILGVILPYYNLIQFLLNNNWSMNGFFDSLFSTYPNAMISADIGIAASSFLLLLIYKKKTKGIKIYKYVVSLFLVGFSLSLPLYLYDHLDFN